jgi:hypothetical protein
LNYSDGTSHYSAELPITDTCQGSETTVYSIPILTGLAGSVASIELQARASMGAGCPSWYPVKGTINVSGWEAPP